MYKIFIFSVVLILNAATEETNGLSLQQRSEISGRLDRLLSAKKLTSRRYAQDSVRGFIKKIILGYLP
jgi:hypothetical protein